MGLYDRDYTRHDSPELGIRGPRTVVGTLIVVNVVLWLINAVFTSDDALTKFLEAKVGALTNPLYWWEFLTYGFAHAKQPQHIIFNMLGLFFLGRDIEERYGSKEFLRIYLLTVLVGGLTWATANWLQGNANVTLKGASGAVAAIVVLYALNFPHRTILLFFVIPVPAWFVGVLLVAGDLYGSMADRSTHIAYSVHLAGAAFAFAYFQLGWNFGRLVPQGWSFDWLKRRPKLRIHNPEDDDVPDGDGMEAEVDRILEKISQTGEASLTRKERRTLENASRRYQERRRDKVDNG